MSSTRENSQAQNFISEIFKIVVESLKSAMLKNQEISNSLKIEQNQSIDSLFEQLASKIQGDSDTITMIHTNLDKYKLSINKALDNNDDDIKGLTGEDF